LSTCDGKDLRIPVSFKECNYLKGKFSGLALTRAVFGGQVWSVTTFFKSGLFFLTIALLAKATRLQSSVPLCVTLAGGLALAVPRFGAALAGAVAMGFGAASTNRKFCTAFRAFLNQAGVVT